MPFCSLIYDNIVLVSRALRNQFIIPDWESFTATIRGFYDKVKAMDSVGHVSTVALQTGTERERETETQSPNQPTNLTCDSSSPERGSSNGASDSD